MQNNINKNCLSIPFFAIDNDKNIVSFNFDLSGNIKLLLLKNPQVGDAFVDVIPQSSRAGFSKIVDKCLAGNTIIADQVLVDQIIKSSFKVQALFISIHINESFTYAVCVFLSNFHLQDQILSSNDYSKFTSHELRAPISNILGLADFENYAHLDSFEDIKIAELLKNIYSQAEKLNNIVTVLNSILNKQQDISQENPIYEKSIVDHIVLVDDDPLVNMMHKMILSRYKKTIIKAFDNPKIALEYIGIHKPDLIFLDINMPEINGWEFLRRLETSSFRAKVIILSSSIDPVDQNAAYTYECVKDYIIKPLTYEKLQTIY